MAVVEDVAAASRWFCSVLGLRSGHGGPEYEMLVDGDVLVAQLHQWEADEHPHLGDPHEPSRGNGVLLWFAVDDLDAVIAAAEAEGATVLDGPLLNPDARQWELWLRGPEGYVVVVAGDRG